jgi:hypothetical protein
VLIKRINRAKCIANFFRLIQISIAVLLSTTIPFSITSTIFPVFNVNAKRPDILYAPSPYIVGHTKLPQAVKLSGAAAVILANTSAAAFRRSPPEPVKASAGHTAISPLSRFCQALFLKVAYKPS